MWEVALAATVTALCTGLGALPFLVVREIGYRWLGLGNAIAAGLMTGASIGLVWEGLAYPCWRLAAGFVVGLVLIVLTRRRLKARAPALELGEIEGANAARMLLIVGVMTAHSFAEGVSVGVAYGGGETFGTFISAAIAVHNIPEGLAISLVMIPRGVSMTRAAGWSIFSSLPQPLMAVPAFLFVLTFESFLPFGLGLAAGAMVYMVMRELLPEASEHLSGGTLWAAFLASTGAMVGFQLLVG